MRQALNLNVVRQLTMTPQLQRALQLLQLSAADLELEITKFLENNCMLELQAEVDGDSINSQGEDHLRLHQGDFAKVRSTVAADELLVTNYSVGKTLQEYLVWQLELSQLSSLDKIIGHILIDSINDNGYLTANVEDIHRVINAELQVTLGEVRAVLHFIQTLDPLGVAAKDLQECLSIQLRALPKSTPLLAQASKLLANYLDLLAQRKFSRLAAKLNVSKSELHAIINIIKTLHPNPGLNFSNVKTDYISYDLIVKKIAGVWAVSLNASFSDKLRINPYYLSMLKTSPKDNKLLQAQLVEAKWFLKSIQDRDANLLKVANCIISAQQEFLEYGVEKLRPLALKDIANVLGLHISTVSRLTHNKYIFTPRGTFALKYFFSSALKSYVGVEGRYATKSIAAVIKTIVRSESSINPLTDYAITQVLSKNGMLISRRTVAKYRELMRIPAVTKRKGTNNCDIKDRGRRADNVY